MSSPMTPPPRASGCFAHAERLRRGPRLRRRGADRHARSFRRAFFRTVRRLRLRSGLMWRATLCVVRRLNVASAVAETGEDGRRFVTYCASFGSRRTASVGPVLPRSARGRHQGDKASSHHLGVSFGVSVGRGDLGMSEPGLDRDAGSTRAHRTASPACCRRTCGDTRTPPSAASSTIRRRT